MFKRFNFILTFIFIILFTSNLFAEVNYYPPKLIDSISTFKKDFNKKNLENVYKDFVDFKGIKDSKIAFTLVDIALNNKNKLNDDIIQLITKFDVDNEKVIRNLLTNNYLNKFTLIPKYINDFSIYVFLKYLTSIFVTILLIALFIKNKFIFFHIHKENAKWLKSLYFLAFLFVPILGFAFFPSYYLIFIAIAAVILLLPEKNNNRMILFAAILIALMIHSVSCDVSKNNNSVDYYSIINNPVSLNYLNYKIKQNPDDYDLKVIKKIKFPNSKVKMSNVPISKFSELGRINLSIYYLMNKKFDKFKKLIKNNALLENPIMLLNLSSYFTITFQYKELEEINKRLYKHDFYYKLAENYQHNMKKSLFIPYSDTKIYAFSEVLGFNMQSAIISILLLTVSFALVIYVSKSKELFKCNSCGNVFCAQCDDGYDYDHICATCRNIIFRKGNAEASILVKKTILMENYKNNLKVLSRVLSTFLPGSGQIYTNHPVKGIFMSILFSIVLFIVIFRFEPFVNPESYALDMVFIPFYAVILGIFVLFYLINILGRK
jgi:hypothetical protein